MLLRTNKITKLQNFLETSQKHHDKIGDVNIFWKAIENIINIQVENTLKQSKPSDYFAK